MANQYDDALKALWAAADLGGLCRWLGVPVDDAAMLGRLAESVPATTTKAVDLITITGPAVLLHVEFQVGGEVRFNFRNLDYRLRLCGIKDFQHLEIHQHVVLLGDGHLDTRIDEHNLSYSYTLHRLADEEPARLLAEPTLVPFAPLARMPDHQRPAMVAHAFELIAAVDDPSLRAILARVTGDLATVRLPGATISSIIKESPMPIPSLYDIGREEGLNAGREEATEQAAATLLHARFGDDERITTIAATLAHLDPTTCMTRILHATSLDELATPD